jgi:hypothetical protein
MAPNLNTSSQVRSLSCTSKPQALEAWEGSLPVTGRAGKTLTNRGQKSPARFVVDDRGAGRLSYPVLCQNQVLII